MNLREFRARSPSVARAKWAPASGISPSASALNDQAEDRQAIGGCSRRRAANGREAPVIALHLPRKRRAAAMRDASRGSNTGLQRQANRQQNQSHTFTH